MSGTSWAGTSPRYDIQLPVRAILHASDDELAGIENSEFFYRVFNDENGVPISVSGKQGDEREGALRQLLTKLTTRPRPDVPSELDRELALLPEGRRRILFLVNSYKEARSVAKDLVAFRPDWGGQVRYLVADETAFATSWECDLRRGDVKYFASTGATFLVAPLLAIERGHNILNEEGKAAIGAAYFLARPHPRPDDISYPVQSMNRWAVERIHQLERSAQEYSPGDLAFLARSIRREGFGRWQEMLKTPLIYGSLEENEKQPALAWTQLVTIWQAIGRLIRGGCAARVHFCDARFFPDADGPSGSLLVGMHRALGEFLGPAAVPDPAEKELAEALYGPFYRSLTALLESSCNVDIR